MHPEGERGGLLEGERGGRAEEDGLHLTVGTLSFVDMGTKELSIDTILLQLDGTGVLSLGGLADNKGFALSLTPEKDLSISLNDLQCNLNPSLQLLQLTTVVQVGLVRSLSPSPTRSWISPGSIPPLLLPPHSLPSAFSFPSRPSC